MATEGKWWDISLNPLTGCSPVSPACDHCYAARLASTRLKHHSAYKRLTKHGKWTGEIRFNPDVLKKNLVFNMMTNNLFGAPHHTYILLTKRPERILEGHPEHFAKWPNIRLGVTVENQQRADERIPALLQIPAAVRFVSLEPLLGPIDLRVPLQIMKKVTTPINKHGQACGPSVEGWRPSYNIDDPLETPLKPLVDWVICGAETGPGARPMDLDWARDIRDQCKAAGIPFWFKSAGPRKEIPSDLMIREWPWGDDENKGG
jgi:protein gp37